MRQWIWAHSTKNQQADGKEQQQWLSDWVLPALFTVLTLACLALLVTETLNNGQAAIGNFNLLTPEVSNGGKTSPVVISAFSG